MTKKAKIKEKTNWSDKIVTGAAIIGAIIFGRLFGFAGIGAVVAGWFVYNKVKTNNFFRNNRWNYFRNSCLLCISISFSIFNSTNLNKGTWQQNAP